MKTKKIGSVEEEGPRAHAVNDAASGPELDAEPDQDRSLHPIGDTWYRKLRQGEKGTPPADRSHSGHKDPQPRQDQVAGRGRQDPSRDPEPQALPTPAHHQALPGDQHALGHLHGHGVRVGRRALRSYRQERSAHRERGTQVLPADHIRCRLLSPTHDRAS